MAIREKLTFAQDVMVTTMNWMEQSGQWNCGVLDIDLDTGAITLYGADCKDFRKEFNRIVEGVCNA